MRMMKAAGAPRGMRMSKGAEEDYYGGERCMAASYDAAEPKASSNILKDYSNFLSCAPLQYFNLKHTDGKLSVDIPDLQNYSQLLIVGCNDDSVVQRVVSVKELLKKEAE